MELHNYFQHVLAFLSVVLMIGSHASLPSEDYWKSVLPNTPMPKAVMELLQPSTEWQENKGTAVNVGYGGVGVNTGRPGDHANIGVKKGDVNDVTRTRSSRPVHVGVHPNQAPFNYQYAAAETQLHDDPNVALFFLEKDLHPGKRLNLNFSESTHGAKFLPLQVADSMPFSSNKLLEIFHKFSVDPRSDKAKVIKKTIEECEDTNINGEEKLCVTSLESMINFSTSKLGKDVEAISTNAENGKMKEYKIVGVRRIYSGKAVVACHKQKYPYPVFYCHKTSKTVAYKVLLVAADKSKSEAVAVCHHDTAAWNPKHLAFQVLKVKPGLLPVCHFLPADHIVWVNKN